MGHTNSTANLSLPQFIGTDKPTWLGDVNGAFSAIDSYAGTNDAAVAAAASDASSAISQAAAAVNTANTANTTAGNASTAATAAVTAANQANALSNQIALRTGVLSDLTTTDKTSIVNAINEVNGKDAGDIAYDNTGSGLTATDVQAAIDEVAQGGGGGKTLKRTVNTDGTSTYVQIFNQFAADLADITDDAYIVYDTVTSKLIYKVSRILSTEADFYYVYMDTTDIDINCIQISANSKYSTSHNGTVTDASTQAPAVGRSYSLYV